jgi:hypothetical protein
VHDHGLHRRGGRISPLHGALNEVAPAASPAAGSLADDACPNGIRADPRDDPQLLLVRHPVPDAREAIEVVNLGVASELKGNAL